MPNNFRVVLDTNAVISSLSYTSPFRSIVDALMDDKFDLYITNEILLEYEELVGQKYNQITRTLFIEALLTAPNVFQIQTYYNLLLIEKDQDDNKFVNCAFAANAHFLVTNDRDFNVLKTLSFPKFNVVRIEEFANIVLSW